MTKYTRFEAIFRNETLVFTDRDPKFRNRLDVYNYICAERLGKDLVAVPELINRVVDVHLIAFHDSDLLLSSKPWIR